jgi:predicted ATP-grasp superfamily ATP-dependent carboligase
VRALILEEGRVRGALAATRALGGDGWTVGSGAPLTGSLSGSSRFAARSHRVPSAAAGTEAFLAAVNAAIAEGGYEVVFSCDDAGVLALSANRERLDATVPYASHSTVMRCFDKLELTRAAEQAGLAVPRTQPADDEHVQDLASGPLVVKPRLAFTEGSAARVSASVVPDLASALARAREMRAVGARPLIQEHVTGHLMAFVALTDRNARIVAQVQQVAERIWPPAAGVSARAHTVAVDDRLAGKVARLLESLGWFGLAQLQFLLGDDGGAHLVDFNGRFYGSLALAMRSGPNLPAIWARLATDRPLPKMAPARVGVRYQWLAGDLRSSWCAESGVARMTAALGSLREAPGATQAVWRVSDPWPAIAQATTRIKGLR